MKYKIIEWLLKLLLSDEEQKTIKKLLQIGVKETQNLLEELATNETLTVGELQKALKELL